MFRDLKWSDTEKKAARKAFQTALSREFEAVTRMTKERAAKIAQPDDLWDLENFLTESRKRIDHEYDYRYSVLPEVFARLILNGRLSEDEIKGLQQDKLELIGRYLEIARSR